MNLDIRAPIGLLFTLTGLLLAAQGGLGDHARLKLDLLGLNIDLLWGVAMTIAGLILLGLVALNRNKAD
ncbi:MAG: hypothetical protein P4L64_09155 [Caulobacteraceae bacterium]|nr:hypothetical protein [Caulobacteraceae bacterium]